MNCPDCQEVMNLELVPQDSYDPSLEDGHKQIEVQMWVCPECGYEVEANINKDDDEDAFLDEFEDMDNSDDGDGVDTL